MSACYLGMGKIWKWSITHRYISYNDIEQKISEITDQNWCRLNGSTSDIQEKVYILHAKEVDGMNGLSFWLLNQRACLSFTFALNYSVSK